MSRRSPLGRCCTAVVVAVVVFAAGCTSSERQPSAAEQVPQLGVVLQRVDTALAGHRFGAARQQLKNLKAQVVEARDSGELRAADAERVLAAITRLLALLPASSAPAEDRESESPATTGPTKTSRPSPSRPESPESTVRSPSTSPSPSPSTSESPSSSPTPDATPTDAATRDASPTGSPSPTP